MNYHIEHKRKFKNYDEQDISLLFVMTEIDAAHKVLSGLDKASTLENWRQIIESKIFKIVEYEIGGENYHWVDFIITLEPQRLLYISFDKNKKYEIKSCVNNITGSSKDEHDFNVPRIIEHYQGLKDKNYEWFDSKVDTPIKLMKQIEKEICSNKNEVKIADFM